ncbi:hypothetical protein [Rhizobium tumorigenes]|uniref:Uncharacterized protein n=1 Tax=Rhizobium tumorigenes TaxID=2041385 RepID=A0AAF1K353_9HYPH|nr:hypothetical protein [Rhizobium tumorigenes]WFR94867.1 hypothetical protein PR017_13795 [Rhizobium tumorigenes]
MHYIRGLQAVAFFRDRLRIDGFVDRSAIIIGTLKVQIISQPSKCRSTETRDQIIHNDCSEHAAALQQDQPTVDNKCLLVMQFHQYGNDVCQVTWHGVPEIQQIFLRYAACVGGFNAQIAYEFRCFGSFCKFSCRV